MAYPKRISLESLTRARERLLAHKIDPAQPVMAENLAHSIMEGSAEPEGWSERATAGPPCVLECSLGELLAQFDDCQELWATLPKISPDYGEGFTDRDGVSWLLYGRDDQADSS